MPAAGLLSGRLSDLALYYRAKAHKDLGRTAGALDAMCQVADAGGRLAPRAPGGMANPARIRGDHVTALAAADPVMERPSPPGPG
ncbi:hypothetical protein ACFYPB_12350 [Streptomyces olivaceoviridis]|uniref:hypothetical protein n=1 Tax=Streptomyces olivaceoviridis TaxID=1921 RepID=UPI00369F3BAE